MGEEGSLDGFFNDSSTSSSNLPQRIPGDMGAQIELADIEDNIEIPLILATTEWLMTWKREIPHLLIHIKTNLDRGDPVELWGELKLGWGAILATIASEPSAHNFRDEMLRFQQEFTAMDAPDKSQLNSLLGSLEEYWIHNI